MGLQRNCFRRSPCFDQTDRGVLISSPSARVTAVIVVVLIIAAIVVILTFIPVVVIIVMMASSPSFAEDLIDFAIGQRHYIQVSVRSRLEVGSDPEVASELVRGEFLVLRTREYTEAARAVGASGPSIVLRELLPNAMGPLIVAATLAIPGAILLESTLSFLGFGIQPPTASWGNMLNNAWEQMRASGAWWIGFFPGLMIALTVLSFNFVGDGLRDALDPRSRAE